jgi:hypothetical protein
MCSFCHGWIAKCFINMYTDMHIIKSASFYSSLLCRSEKDLGIWEEEEDGPLALGRAVKAKEQQQPGRS